ncbi:MAG: hypothetical protein PHU12_03275 [Candidatus Aenigmarchaeota archaeon]|nr:hypothetical protein [Candidatus Aenigmarchaeota archaeon]
MNKNCDRTNCPFCNICYGTSGDCFGNNPTLREHVNFPDGVGAETLMERYQPSMRG